MANEKSKIYIAGPMTGIYEYNKDAFQEAEDYLSELGWDVVNPHKLHGDLVKLEDADGDEPLSRRDLRQIIREDLAALVECDAIYMLEGHEHSQGAKVELAVAEWMQIQVIYR